MELLDQKCMMLRFLHIIKTAFMQRPTNSTTDCPLPWTHRRVAIIINFSFVANFGGGHRLLRSLDIFPNFNGNLHSKSLPLMFFSIGLYVSFSDYFIYNASCKPRILTHFSAIFVKFVIRLLILFLAFDVLNFYVNHQYSHLWLLPLWHLEIPSLPKIINLNMWTF